MQTRSCNVRGTSFSVWSFRAAGELSGVSRQLSGKPERGSALKGLCPSAQGNALGKSQGDNDRAAVQENVVRKCDHRRSVADKAFAWAWRRTPTYSAPSPAEDRKLYFPSILACQSIPISGRGGVGLGKVVARSATTDGEPTSLINSAR